MSAFFITAVGTEIGKTLLTTGLAWQLRQTGQKVLAIKPFITGFTEKDLALSDIGQLLAACDLPVTMQEAQKISPWRYERPVSPHIAAAHHSPAIQDIEAFCKQACEVSAITLIEGAGGVMTPLVQGYTQLDLMQALRKPVILVSGNYLGAISHTLTALEALKARGVSVQAVVISESENTGASLQETKDAILAHAPLLTPVFTLARQAVVSQPWQHLPPLLEVIHHV